jgi:hypothetical protein
VEKVLPRLSGRSLKFRMLLHQSFSIEAVEGGDSGSECLQHSRVAGSSKPIYHTWHALKRWSLAVHSTLQILVKTKYG